MTYSAFALSESLRLPIVIRITTRLAHSRGNVTRRPQLPQNAICFPEDDRQFILLPANARRNYAALIEKQAELISLSEGSEYNTLQLKGNPELGIIACGLTINYLAELYGNRESIPFPFLAIRQYPAPTKQIRQIFEQCSKVLIIEEGAPLLEEMAQGILPSPYRISGRLDGTLPRVGELTPDDIAHALGMTPKTLKKGSDDAVKMRPPQLCKGCPHIDSYTFMKEVLADFPMARVFADIGCYTLGALPPYSAIHTTVDMGASITMAKGASDAGVHPAIAVIGDSTFGHSGITGLLDAVYENTNMTILILDNATTAMTGQQQSMTTGSTLEALIEGLGLNRDHIRVINPLPKHHEENKAILLEEIKHPGVSVIIPRRPCIQIRH
jgi:indolepyruvate ferredoxin oxidoreductase alpha subunit